MFSAPSLLQSEAWAKLQTALGRTVRRVPETRTLLVSLPLPFGLRYEYAPHGPSPETFRGGALHELVAHTRGAQTVFLRIEPRVPETPQAIAVLTHAGFRRAPDVQPRETIFVDLTKSEEALLKDMEHDTRYAIRTAEKRGVAIAVFEGAARRAAFAKFWELFEATNVRHGLHAYDKRYYEAVASLEGDARSELFLAEHEGKTLAAAIVAHHHDTAYYLYAASRAGYGKWNAPSFLLWNVIVRAKAKGFRALDLWGISSTKKRWAGVTAFKKSFGGVKTAFVGTWDYAYRPLWYEGYRTAKYFRK